MLQQRKKDYLQRLIDEFFAKFQELIRNNPDLSNSDRKELLNKGFDFFNTHFEVKQSDDSQTLIEKIGDFDLLEQYAKLMQLRYETVDIKEPQSLHLALDILKYLSEADKTYSWNRTVLREDLLRILNDEENMN